MSLDFSTLIFGPVRIMALQPLLMGRWYRRAARAGDPRHREGARHARHHHDPSPGEAQPVRLLGRPAHRPGGRPDHHRRDQGDAARRPDRSGAAHARRPRAGGDADRARGRGAPGQGHRLCAGLRHVGRHADRAGGRRDRAGRVLGARARSIRRSRASRRPASSRRATPSRSPRCSISPWCWPTSARRRWRRSSGAQSSC